MQAWFKTATCPVQIEKSSAEKKKKLNFSLTKRRKTLDFYAQSLRNPRTSKGRSSCAINDGPVQLLGSDTIMATTFDSG